MADDSSSSSSSDSDQEVTWAEKKVNVNDDWLGTAIGNSASFGKDSLLSKRDLKLTIKKKEDKERQKVYQSRELNPFMKDGSGQESSSTKSTTEATGSKPAHSAAGSDCGVGWLQKAYDRVHQQAHEQGISADEVAKERWGSLSKLKQMLDEAKLKYREAGGGNSGRSHGDGGKSLYRTSGYGRDRFNDRRGDNQTSHRQDDRNNSNQRQREPERRDSRLPREDQSSKSKHDEENDIYGRASRSDVQMKRRPEEEPSRTSINQRNAQPKLQVHKEPIRAVEVQRAELPKVTSVKVATEVEMTPMPTLAKLTDGEKNAIHAKIMKAEMLGNVELVETLKAKLEYYQTNATEIAHREQPGREITMVPKISEENLTLKQMFLREKNMSAADETKMYLSAAGRSINPKNMDDEYEVERKAKKVKTDRQGDQFYAKSERKVAEECNDCMSKTSRHLILAFGKQVYLSFGRTVPLVEGSAFITSIGHSFKSVVGADEDCVAEISSIKSALCQYFKDKHKSVIFMESFRKRSSSNRNHLKIECFPIDSELLGETKMYFKVIIINKLISSSRGYAFVGLS